MNALLEAALSYAKMGWHVFPCIAGSKQPLTPRGLHDATTDEKIIQGWWEKWPAANVAVNCGASGLAVVDLDVKNEADGIREWEAWKAGQGGILLAGKWDTATVTTPSGGKHLYYLGEIRNSASKIAPGIDTRGLGGYVVAPPSVIAGVPYRWVATEWVTLAVIPQAVVEAVGAKKEPVSRVATHPPSSAIAAGSLVDLITQDGYHLERKGRLNEWAGPCPWCGGHDRFVVGWEGEGRDGRERYYCRRCERKGDSVSWLIDKKGLHPVEAKDARGVHVPPEYRKLEPKNWFGEHVAQVEGISATPRGDIDMPRIEMPRPPMGAFQDKEGPGQPDPPWITFNKGVKLMSKDEPQPTIWAVDGLIEAHTATIWYGKPGSLKSFFCADLALHIAAGAPWLGSRDSGGEAPVRVTQGRFGWIDVDNGYNRSHHRFHALAKASGLTGEGGDYYLFPPIDLTKADCLHLLERLIREKRFDHLFIDTLINSTTIKNENDNAEWRPVLVGIRTLTEVTGCNLHLIDHPRKGLATGKVADDVRGGTAKVGAMDLVLRVERDDDRVKVSATKARGEEIKDIYAEFVVTRSNLGVMETAKFYTTEAFDVTDQTQVISVEVGKNIINALKKSKEDMSSNAIAQEVGGRKQSVLKVLQELAKAGKISSRPGPGKTVYYGII